MRVVVLLTLLAICGCGGSSGDTPAPFLNSISVALDGLAGTSYELRGGNFPGSAGTNYTVRFSSAGGPIFDDCETSEITGTVRWVSETTLRGTAPATHVLVDARAHVTVQLPGGALQSATPIATFLGTPDPAQDQDGNGIRDGCDPRTYDFEGDTLGARPGEISQLGFPTNFEVAEVGGDKVARYTGGSSGSADRLDRLMADHAFQNTTVYVDWDETDSVGSIELWSEGSFSDNAGSGLIIQVRNGLIFFFQRVWRNVPSVIGQALPANGRMRIRVRKGAGDTSAVHIDTWSGSDWLEDYEVFPIADDRWFRGRATVLSEYSGGLRGIKRITVVHEHPPAALIVPETPEGLMAWKLYQRDANDQATLPVPVLYRLASRGRVEARVVNTDDGLPLPGHDFSDHGITVEAAADGARAHLDLAAVPTGGNYDVEVRLLDESGATVSQVAVKDVAVGDVYICAGQSNMSGYSGGLTGATPSIPEVHRFHNNGRWDQAVEPVDVGLFQLDRVSFENPLHSLALPFGKALYEATGVPVALVPTSLGGTNLYVQWQRNATVPAWRAVLYGSMLHRARVASGPNPPAGLLWFQGESDALAARTTAQYEADLEQLIASARADLTAPNMVAIVAQLGTFSAANLDLWLPVQEAERQVAKSDPITALVPTVDATRSDVIHYDVPGYQLIGTRFADAVRVLKFGHAIDPIAELVSALTGAGGTTIELTYDALVSGGDASLFRVSDDVGAAAVTGIAVNGTVITLTLDRALSGAATVSYGYAVLPTAAWVTDVGGTPVPCFHAIPVGP